MAKEESEKKKGHCKQFKSRTPVAGVSPPEGLFSLFIRPAFGCWLTLKNFIQVDSLATRYRRQLAVFFSFKVLELHVTDNMCALLD